MWRALVMLLCWACLAGLAAGQTPVAPGIPTHEVKHLFDIHATAHGPLSLPSDVAADRTRIYVVDGGNHRVVIFAADGAYLFHIGSEGIEDGEFRDPVGLGIDGNGRIYVADTGNHRIQVFDQRGTFVRKFSVISDGTPVRPVDVAVGPDATLYISGNNNHKVMAYTSQGQLLREWGGIGVDQGQFRYPATVAMVPDGRIAVVDGLNTRVQIFDRMGEFSLQVGDWGVLPGQLFRPKGVAVDADGRVYISDGYMNLVQVYADTGRFMYVLGQRHKPAEVMTPGGIAVQDNRLYVAEMRRNAVSVHQVAPYRKGE